MPRRSTLSEIAPNRFYEIDATLKYQHVGENAITGIIQQDEIQTKISIPKDGIELEEGKKYTFGKCFNSKNGWLYAKNPLQTVTQKSQGKSHETYYSLRELYEERTRLANHYVDTVLKVISIEPKQEVRKKDENLILYNMKCFEDDLMVNVEIWNHEINIEELKGKVVKFIGFKVKATSHNTITMVSTVYSKIEKLSRLPYNRENYVYDSKKMYKSVSSYYEIRTIEELENACEKVHKNYSIISALINNSEELTYEGCNKCKKKIQDNRCYLCGSKITKKVYNYLKITLEDDTGMMECAVFDEESLSKIKELGENKKAYFFVTSSAKKNHEIDEFFTSHVVKQVKFMENSQ